MKKMMIAALALVATAATAQVKGRFEVHDMAASGCTSTTPTT